MPSTCEVFVRVERVPGARYAVRGEVALRLTGVSRWRTPEAGLLAVFDVAGFGALAVVPSGWVWLAAPPSTAFGDGRLCTPTHLHALSVPSMGVDEEFDFPAELRDGTSLLHRQRVPVALLPSPGDTTGFDVRIAAELRGPHANGNVVPGDAVACGAWARIGRYRERPMCGAVFEAAAWFGDDPDPKRRRV